MSWNNQSAHIKKILTKSQQTWSLSNGALGRHMQISIAALRLSYFFRLFSGMDPPSPSKSQASCAGETTGQYAFVRQAKTGSEHWDSKSGSANDAGIREHVEVAEEEHEDGWEANADTSGVATVVDISVL
jgi:hypothetical protein